MKSRKMGDSSIVSRANEENFGFAFNDFDFSDRVLRLEIIPNDESIDSCKKTRKRKNKDSESYNGIKVVTLNINSAILAAKSPFFYKLFKNGMRESQQRNDVSLRIGAFEEGTLMDLLNFMYGNKLIATSVIDLVDLLIAADKFEVTSCMRHSIQMLLKLPMSLEDAISYLELPSSVLVSDIVRPLIDEAKAYIFARYKDLSKSHDEATKLPLSALEVVLGSEGLLVDSEDYLYDFILKWTRVSYSKLEERREILTKRLAQFVCFPNMSCSKLKEVLACPDFDHEHVSKIVVEALITKVENGQQIQASEDLATNKCGFLGRIYKPYCVVYFNLKKDECADLFPKKGLDSQHFCLGGKRLYLSAYCGEKEDRFGLFVHRERSSGTCTIDFEFEWKKKSSKEFHGKGKANNHTLGDNGRGYRDLLGIPWTEFMSDTSDCFIEGILHLRAKITLINNAQP